MEIDDRAWPALIQRTGQRTQTRRAGLHLPNTDTLCDMNDQAGEPQTHLQQIIAGLTEGVIIMHPDRTIAWANDTALALHGVNRLADLGRNPADYRARFELHLIDGHPLPAADYPMDRLLAGETFRELVLRVAPRGKDHSWVHQIRTMILTDRDGRPDTLVLIVEDQTDRFNAEERFERAFAANPAPAIIARLADMRYVKVNQGFLELTGWTREALIGHSMHEIDVLRAPEKRDLAVARLHAGATIPQMEALLPLPDDGEKTVLLGGQPLEIGDEACMLFTFADLHPRKQAEEALRQSEERFAKTFRMAPGPMAILTLDGLRLLDANDAFTTATGWRREEVVGRGQADIGLWGEGDRSADVERQIRHTGHVRSVDVQLRTKSGERNDYLLSAETVQIGRERCVLSVMLDITERKQTETALLAAIDSVMADTSWFGQKIVEKLANLTGANRSAGRPTELATLSERAREVLGLVAGGLSDEEIARKLGISRNTVRNHVAAIYTRIGVHRRAAVVVWARERGLGASAKPKLAKSKPAPVARQQRKTPAR